MNFHYVYLLFLCFGISHLQAQTIQTGLVNYVSHTNNGTVKLTVTMFGNKKKTIRNASDRAFHVLLFEGLAKATKIKLREPFIRHERQAKEKHADYLQYFFDQEGYLQYLQTISKPKRTKVKGLGKRKAYEFTLIINYENLLRDLRRKGMIEKMGF